LNNPPNTGDIIIREQTILALDNILKNDSGCTVNNIYDFFLARMEKVPQEFEDTVSVASIWLIYNHGFIIKTPQLVFAFDVVFGCTEWPSTHLWLGIESLPEIISQIDILFISHEHGDHNNTDIRQAVIAKGGYVVVPSDGKVYGNVPMASGDSLNLLGLQIKAHFGFHGDVPTRIFEVTTQNSLKIVHTGDNQTSET
jgi:hypothetical protein